MRFAVLTALTACSGPIQPPHTRPAAVPEASVLRPPPNAPPDPLGTVRPGSRSCTEDRDCKAGETCVPPDFQPAAAPPQCQTDAQCSDGRICADGSCVAPCTPASCGTGQECTADGHCRPIPCTAAGAPACPLNHRCNAATGSCDRQACASRAQCDAGVCYRGRCFGHDAYCWPAGS